MRILFLFLLLLNLGYFMWQWPQHSNEKILPSGPLPVTPNSKVLTLLSETNNPSATDKQSGSDGAQQGPAAPNP